jgi:hypothetical protein
MTIEQGIKNRHLVAVVEQIFTATASYVSGTAGDQYVHR